MLAVPTAVDVVRLMQIWALRADQHLARSAERNAGYSVNEVASRDLENARTLRDMRRVMGEPGDEDPLG